ncbi:MAG: hypothetical protein JEY97_10200 [Bacteroidales bacterium]|nr:hypothetical protein [Bacteroidales bacterium]
MKKFFIIICLLIFTFIVGCKKNSESDDVEKFSNLTLKFAYYNEGKLLEFDTIIYENEAGNKYLVNEIQYFISDVILHKSNGENILIDEWKDIHYIDTDILSTQTWKIPDKLTPGNYNSISFTFGISEAKNHSLMFLNPPERDMFWPEYLGGGYHYMKLNGKWLSDENTINPFDFHLGIGQIYHSYPDSITGFIQNYFEVNLPSSSFELIENQTKEIEISMNIENWFRNPNIYDHDVYGGDIMQNQEAMNLACENGHNVFTIKIIN